MAETIPPLSARELTIVAQEVVREINTLFPHDTARDDPEFDDFEATLSPSLKRESRPILEIGYRLTAQDCTRIADNVLDQLAEALERKRDKEEAQRIEGFTTDRQERPEFQELIQRAIRQANECERAQKHLEDTISKINEAMASDDDDDNEEAAERQA